MNDTLELLPLDTTAERPAPAPAAPKTEIAVAAKQTLDLTKIDLTDVALAHFGDWKAKVAAAEKAFDGVVFDVSTTTKLNEVKSLRQRMVNEPRADARKVSEALKSKLAKVSKAVGAELETAVAEFGRVEAIANVTIEAREKELEEERQRELDRKAKHGANLAQIRACLQRAQGLPSDRIANGIQMLQGMTFGEEWEEFAALADTAREETLAAMLALLNNTLDAEAKAAENERMRLEHEAQQRALALTRRAMACMGKPAAVVRDELNLLELTTYAEDAAPIVLEAHDQAVAQLKILLGMAEQQEATAAKARQEEEARAAQVAPPAVEPPAPKAIGGLQGQAVDVPAAIHEPATEAEPVAVAVAEPAPSEADEPAADLMDVGTDPVSVIRDAAELLAFLGGELNGRFKSHPKPSAEWWGTLRVMADNLAPRLTVLREMFGDDQ